MTCSQLLVLLVSPHIRGQMSFPGHFTISFELLNSLREDNNGRKELIKEHIIAVMLSTFYLGHFCYFHLEKKRN